MLRCRLIKAETQANRCEIVINTKWRILALFHGNQIVFLYFMHTYAPNLRNVSLSKIKYVLGTIFPPQRNVLSFQVKNSLSTLNYDSQYTRMPLLFLPRGKKGVGVNVDCSWVVVPVLRTRRQHSMRRRKTGARPGQVYYLRFNIHYPETWR